MKTPLHFRTGIVFIFILAAAAASGQQLELGSSSASTSAKGPATTAQTATFYQNTGTSTTFGNYLPGLTVTVSLGNQQYNTASTPGLTMGSSSAGSGGSLNSMGQDNIFVPLNKLGSPLASYFNSPPNTASNTIDVTNNYSFLFTTDAYYQTTIGAALNARNYYGDVTVAFSKGVINPVLHFSGMGGANTASSWVQGYYTEFELSTADVNAGRTLTYLSGSTYFAVDATKTKIVNTNTSKTSSSSTPYASTQQYAGAGSVYVNTNGAPITSVTFRVYFKGDGGTSGTPSNGWATGTSSTRPGDSWVLSTSIGMYNITGTVYNDGDGNNDSKVDGNGTNAGGTLYANLVDASNNIVATVPVASDGTYTLSAILGTTNNYTVVLTTSASSTTPALPSPYVNTGENIGAGTGNDGTADGKLAVTLTSSGVSNANFGINRPPTANTINGSSQVNPGGTGTVTVPTLTGSDPEDGTYNGTSGTNTIKIQTLPTNGTLYYNGNPVASGAVITNYTPALLTFDPNDGITSASFTFSEVDAGGLISPAATVTMPFTSSITGTVFDDGDGMNDSQVDGTGTNAGGLNAILYDNTTNKVVGVVAVASNGTYTLSGTPGDSYSIYITTATATVGSSTVPTVTMPSGWFNVGENLGSGTGSDGTPNGVLSVGTLSSNVSNANFGIDKQPTGNNVTTTAQPNPGGTTQVVVPSTVFNGTDNEDGTYPTGLTGRTVTLNPTTSGGTLYYNGATVTAATTITNFDPSKVTVDPTATGATNVVFTYTVKDNAGVASANITASIQFSAPVITISGTVWNDANADAVKGGSETFTNGGGLYVNLVLASTGAVVQSVPVNASTGAYSFGAAASTQYKVILTSGGQTVGNTLSASSMPSGWVNTGVNLGGTANTANKTGVITFTTPSSGTVTNQNFGVLQCSSTSLSVLASASTPAPAGYVCKASPSTVTLTSTPAGGLASYASYVWAGNGLTAANTQNTTANPTATGTFSVTVTDALGCTATGTTQTITYDDAKPSIFASCVSGAVRLTDLNNIGVSWQWTTTSGGRFYETPDYSVSTDGDVSNLPGPYINIKGNYTLQVTDANGCVSTDTKLIQADPCGNTVLASNMLGVTAQRQGSSVQLQWKTANESGISNYTIERSADGSTFTVAGVVPSLNTDSHTYSFTDDVSLVGCIKLYYRVKQTNADGLTYYSNIIPVSCNANNADEYVLKVYPNPVQSNGWLTVTYSLPAQGSKAQAIVVDVLGNKQYTAVLSNTSGSINTTAIPVSNMPAGTYFVCIVSENWVSKTIKVIKGQ